MISSDIRFRLTWRCVALMAVACVGCGGQNQKDSCLALAGKTIDTSKLGGSGEPQCSMVRPVSDACYGLYGPFDFYRGPRCEDVTCCAAPACYTGCTADCAAAGYEGVKTWRLYGNYGRPNTPPGADVYNIGSCSVMTRDNIVLAAKWNGESR
jgi:hypothetical protein